MDEQILLKNYKSLKRKHFQNNTQQRGIFPTQRPLKEYLNYGIILIDKPKNPSSHEVVTWLKNILKVEKTGHSGTLDPQVSGLLPIALNRSTCLVKAQQEAGKEYVCTAEFENEVDEEKLKRALKFFTNKVYQRPPLMCAVKRTLRMRHIYNIEFLEMKGKRALFKVSCQAGTYIRTLCTHLGLFLGVEGKMVDLRRSRSGFMHENEAVTLFDILDAQHIYEDTGEEKYLRKLIKPVEYFLQNLKRIIIKDSSIEAVCTGAQLTISGVLFYDPTINVGEEVVLISMKGEAIGIANALMCAADICENERGHVTKTKRIIMERGNYEKCWSVKKEFEVLSDDN